MNGERPAILDVLDNYARLMRDRNDPARPSLVNLMITKGEELRIDRRMNGPMAVFDEPEGPRGGTVWIARLLDAVEPVSRAMTGRYLRRLAGDAADLVIEGEPARVPEGSEDRAKAMTGGFD